PPPAAVASTVVYPSSGPYTQITLIDGKAPVPPTDYVGAVRVRALPPGTQIIGAPPRQGKHVHVSLDVPPEPKIQWQRILDCRIDAAIDNQGQALQPAKAAAAPAANGPVAAAALIAPSRPIGRQIPLQFQPGDKPSKSLKELKGTLSAQIRTPPQRLVSVD